MALNLNIGVLGHVDSGKTSVSKALSDIASTAAFDKNPQSQARGITLDLGFSSFSIPTPNHLKNECDFETIQYTLVDCPGHASLLKTIIGGAQIIDIMLLVIDAAKGMQTQTAECLVIGEITCRKMMVILNKIDLFEQDKRDALVTKAKKKITASLSKTLFANSPIMCVSSNPNNFIGIAEAIEQIANYSFVPKRAKDGPLLFSVDHCFQIKGHGTVMTGTVLNGSIEVNDIVDIPCLNITKKVKSMQMFKKSVESASQGDRLGVCVTQFDSKLLERGIVCTPNYAFYAHCVVINFCKIKYFKKEISSKSKYHITLGHNTVMGTLVLFQTNKAYGKFNKDAEYKFVDKINEESEGCYFALIEFEKPTIIVEDSILFGSKLDMNIHSNTCRIAFWGRIVCNSKEKDYKTTFFPTLKVYKTKLKEGVLERVTEQNTIIVKNMFKKETDLQEFINFRVELSTGDIGRISSTFGKSGKIKVILENNLDPSIINRFKKKSDIFETESNVSADITHLKNNDSIKVKLEFKRYIFDVSKKNWQ